MSNAPKTDALQARFSRFGPMADRNLNELWDLARTNECEAGRWRELADRLAQRLRSLPESIPDARDRAVLKDYKEMSR